MLEVATLGAVRIASAGREHTALAQQPLRCSLFLYCCVQRTTTREALVRTFWPDRDPEHGRRLLSQALYEIKRTLGQEWLEVRGEQLQVQGVEVDLHAMEAAAAAGEVERAASLYRGRFLADFSRSDAVAIDQWIDQWAAHAERLHRRVRREAIARADQEGDEERSLHHAQRWLELDPLEDEAVHRTMEHLHRLGRRAEALQVYEVYRSRLREELELEPLEETKALAEAVRQSDTSPTIIRAVPPLRPAPSPTPVTPAAVAKPSPRAGRRVVFAAAALLGIVTLAWVAFKRDEAQPSASQVLLDPAGAPLSRVAVLYLEDDSPDGSLRSLAGSLTGELIDQLGRVDALSVISRNGVKPFRDAPVTMDSIVRALDVGTLIEGNIQQSGAQVRVRVHLVDARTGERIASAEATRPQGELFRLQSDLVREVTALLRRRLGQEIALREDRRRARNDEAWRAHASADALLEEVLTLNPVLEAGNPPRWRSMLAAADSQAARAERLDAEWSDPRLLRGWVAFAAAMLDRPAPPERFAGRMAPAIEAATRVLRREPENAGALELRGTALMRTALHGAAGQQTDSLMARAETDLRAAVRFDPARASAWSTLSRIREYSGAPAEAILYAQRALETDAFLRDTRDIYYRLYRIAVDLERFDEAARWCHDGFAAYRTHHLFLECQLVLPAWAPGATIPVDSARTILRALSNLDRAQASDRVDYKHVFRLTLLASIMARNGQQDSARETFEEARALVQRDPALAPPFGFDAAHVLLLLGDTAGARTALRDYVARNPRYDSYVRDFFAFRALNDL